ncbi:MAG: prepilin-type N-terminal cleavage/methylation domain-containing protein [Bacilli bacterium]|nr:prepilin-type N-terminal cleavage/methylation domain-containing protein [Bacilli bacterium]MDD4298315.1 prepilin-type N-terminal cleavage/methylation domain-containing protein [Bacilli bacterium]
MFKNKKGFTLVELLAVIVILAIILAIAIPGITGMVDKAKLSALESDAKMLITGLEYQQLQGQFGTAEITVTAPYTLVSNDFIVLNANSANYVTVKIVETSPIKLCVITDSNSKFGAAKKLVTKSSFTDLGTETCP